MGRQRDIRALSHAVGKEGRSLARDLQHRGTKGTQKAVGIAWAKARARAARYDDNGPMPISPARVAQCAALRGVRWNLRKRDGRIGIEVPKRAHDAGRTRERAVEKGQSLDPAVIRDEKRGNWIDSAERELLTCRFEAYPAHFVGQPVPGYLIDRRFGAVETLLLVGPNNSADALPHGPTPVGGAECCETGASARLDVGGPDHFGPFLGVIADELAEIARRAREHHAAEAGEPRLHSRLIEGGVDFDIELFDYRRWRVSGRNEPDPLARLKARNKFAQRWNIRQRFRARGRRHRQCPQRAGLDISERRCQLGEHDLD